MNATELAQYIVQQSDGTTLDELRSRSKALSKSLRKIRMLERQLEQDGDTNQLQRQWQVLYRKTHVLQNNTYNWAAPVERIESELAELPLCDLPDTPEFLPGGKWDVVDNQNQIQWMHDCKLYMPDGSVEDMGTFLVRLNPSRRCIGNGIYVYPVKNCYEFHSSHPHVGSGQNLCTGDAGEVLTNLKRTHDWAAIYDIISATLDTFNPDSPFWRIDRMHQEMRRCRRCGHDSQRDPERDMIPDPLWDSNGPYRPRLVCSECIEAERKAAFNNALRDAQRNHHVQLIRRRQHDDT
tara:strand:- start:1736 stop:2617 length:882 start_codon:yes stop_codon:yes gene_type:complete